MLKTKGVRWFAMVIAACLLLSACSGGGSGSSGDAGQSASGSGSDGAQAQAPAGQPERQEPLTLTYWAGLTASQARSLQSFNDLLLYQELEKRTGIHIDFQHPAVGSEQEQFNLMIASGNLPDMIEYNFTSYPGGPEKALLDNVIIELNDVIEQHAPNLKKFLDENPELKKQVVTDSGKMYVFPGIGIGNRGVNSGLMIRKDWLDDLGLENPVTIDDWTNVLRAFKNEKSASAPLTLTLSNLLGSHTFNSAYDVGVDFYLDNGTVKYGPIEPGFKDYLAQLNAWYEEGLFDPDFATQDNAAFDAKIINGNSGAFYAFIGSGMGKYLPALAEKDPKYEVVAAQYPVLSAGQEPRFITFPFEYRGGGSVGITTANKNVEATAKWLDYFFTEEGHVLKSWGVEGVTFNWEGDFPRYTDLIMNNPDGLSIGDAMSKYTRVNTPAVGFVGPDEYIEQYYDYPQQKEAAAVFSEYQSNAAETRMPLVSHTPEEANDLATIMAEVNTYKEEMILKFIMGSEPIDNFDGFVDQLKRMGIERAIEMKAAAVERYKQR